MHIQVQNGFVQLICQHLKERVLPNLPIEAGKDESDIRVGFVTYDKAVHFYNVKVRRLRTLRYVQSRAPRD